MKFIILLTISTISSSFLLNSIPIEWKKIEEIFNSPEPKNNKLLSKIFSTEDQEDPHIKKIFYLYNNTWANPKSLAMPIYEEPNKEANSIKNIKHDFIKWILIFREFLKAYIYEEINEENGSVGGGNLFLILRKLEEEISVVNYKDQWVWWDKWLEQSSFFTPKKEFKKENTIRKLNFNSIGENIVKLEADNKIKYPSQVFQWKQEYKKNKTFSWLYKNKKNRTAQDYASLGSCTWIPFGQLWHYTKAMWLLVSTAESKIINSKHNIKSVYKEEREMKNLEALFKEIQKMENIIENKKIPFVQLKNIVGEMPDFLVTFIDSLINENVVTYFKMEKKPMIIGLASCKILLRILLDRIEIFLDVRNMETGELSAEAISAGAFSF